MHNNLPDETQLPNGQVISMMAVVVRMRIEVVVVVVRMRIIVSTEQKMWSVEVAKKVVFALMMEDLFHACTNMCALIVLQLDLIFFCLSAEVRAVEPRAARCAVHGREVPRDLGQSQTALLRLRRLCLLEIHPLTQCRCGKELFVNY